MKKLLIMMVISALHISFAHGMLNIYDNAKAFVHYVDKNYFNTAGYVLDSQNAKLYQSVLDDMDKKEIKELRTARFSDEDNLMHTFEDTLGKRVADRLNKLIYCLLQQSLIQDPVLRDDTKLSDMIKVNRLIIPDLYLALALHALQEQRDKKVPVVNTGSLIVDVLLHKIELLSESEQFLLKSKLLDDDEQITVDQKRTLAETYFLSLPQTEQENLLQKMNKKKTPSQSAVHTNKQARNNTPTRSREETLKPTSDYDENKESSSGKKQTIIRFNKSENSPSTQVSDKEQQEKRLEGEQKKIIANAETQEDWTNIDNHLDNTNSINVDNTLSNEQEEGLS